MSRTPLTKYKLPSLCPVTAKCHLFKVEGVEARPYLKVPCPLYLQGGMHACEQICIGPGVSNTAREPGNNLSSAETSYDTPELIASN